MKSGSIKWGQTGQSTGPEQWLGMDRCRQGFQRNARVGHRGEDKARQEANKALSQADGGRG